MLGIIYVFDKKGKLKQKDFKAQVENYFDTLITALIEKMKSGGSIEDWWHKNCRIIVEGVFNAKSRQ